MRRSRSRRPVKTSLSELPYFGEGLLLRSLRSLRSWPVGVEAGSGEMDILCEDGEPAD